MLQEIPHLKFEGTRQVRSLHQFFKEHSSVNPAVYDVHLQLREQRVRIGYHCVYFPHHALDIFASFDLLPELEDVSKLHDNVHLSNAVLLLVTVLFKMSQHIL
jgi:Fe2+ or Zn2+ uptake regulation protein